MAAQDFGDFVLEVAQAGDGAPVRLAGTARPTFGEVGALGVGEELAQVRGAEGGGAGEVDLRALDGGEDDDLLLGARDGDVEAALAAGAVERAEVHREVALLVGRVADGEEDRVAFVALDVLEVLHEERLGERGVEEALDLGMLRLLLVEQVLDEPLLRHAEGDDAAGLVGEGRVEQALDDGGDDGLGLLAVGARAGAAVDAVHLDAPHAEPLARRGGGGEGVEPSVVVALVGERDERLVAGAVVPQERLLRNARGLAFVEDAVEVLDLLLSGVGLLVLGAARVLPLLEEVGRRELLWVSHDDGLFAAREHADGVPHGELRGLVEHDDVERALPGGQVLRDGERAHQQARLEDGQEPRQRLEEEARRLLARLLRDLVVEERELGGEGAVLRRLHLREREVREHHVAREPGDLRVELAERLDGGVLRAAEEVAQRRVGVERRAREALAVAHAQRGDGGVRRQRAALDGRRERRESGLGARGRRRAEAAPLAQPGLALGGEVEDRLGAEQERGRRDGAFRRPGGVAERLRRGAEGLPRVHDALDDAGVGVAERGGVGARGAERVERVEERGQVGGAQLRLRAARGGRGERGLADRAALEGAREAEPVREVVPRGAERGNVERRGLLLVESRPVADERRAAREAALAGEELRLGGAPLLLERHDRAAERAGEGWERPGRGGERLRPRGRPLRRADRAERVEELGRHVARGGGERLGERGRRRIRALRERRVGKLRRAFAGVRRVRHQVREGAVGREAAGMRAVERGDGAVERAARRAQVGERRVPRLGRLGAAVVERLLELAQHLGLAGLVRMQLQAERREPDLAEAALHHLERGALLGDEEHGLAGGHAAGDQVRDRLRLARSGRPVQDEVAPAHRGHHRGELRGVRRDRARRPGGVGERVDLPRLDRRDAVVERATAREQVRDDGRLREVVEPRREVAPHQELVEREAADPDLGLDRPFRERRHGRAVGREDLREVDAVLVLRHRVRARDLDALLAAEHLEERDVRRGILVRAAQGESLLARETLELDRVEHERCAIDRSRIALAVLPLQDAEREEERARAAFLQIVARRAVEPE